MMLSKVLYCPELRGYEKWAREKSRRKMTLILLRSKGKERRGRED